VRPETGFGLNRLLRREIPGDLGRSASRRLRRLFGLTVAALRIQQVSLRCSLLAPTSPRLATSTRPETGRRAGTELAKRTRATHPRGELMSRIRALSLFALCSLAAACGSVDPTTDQSEESLRKSCHSNAQCNSLQFCDTEASGTCGGKGVCTSRGVNLLCAANQPAVCGCDGKTYPGGCYAHKAGTSVASDGACPVKCQTNADCGNLQYCKKADGKCGGSGTCEARGITLFCVQTVDPVCGCDGQTYNNGCYAMKAGASIDHKGACTCDDQAANIDGDTLAEQPWMDSTENYFYTFTGNGTLINDSGTFTSVHEPPCTRSVPRCEIAFAPRSGTFKTHGSTVDLTYTSGFGPATASFRAELDCHNSWKLTGSDFNQSLTLVVSTLAP
jgi:hypothetical protein